MQGSEWEARRAAIDAIPIRPASAAAPAPDFPWPEPYRAAARLLGVEPADCVAIEDSPTGVRSAVAAGVPTIAVPHVVAVPAQAGAVHLDTLAGVTPESLWEHARSAVGR